MTALAAAPPYLATPQFTCGRYEDNLGSTWVHPTGELDLATAPQLEEMLSQAQRDTRPVVLDLRDLVFIDCVGMHVVINAVRHARRRGRRLRVMRGPPQIDRVFTLTGSVHLPEMTEPDPAEPPAA